MLRILTLLGLGAMLATPKQAAVDATSAAVPASLLEAAQQTTVDFAGALASASVAAGFELEEADDGPPSGKTMAPGDRDRKVPLADVANAFEARHLAYRAGVLRGVLVIRPAQDALPFLDEPSTIFPPATIEGVMAAARRVFLPIDPRLSGPALNSLGRPSDAIPLTLDGSGGRKVIDTLNQIVSQAPGRAWVVTTRKVGNEVRLVGFGFIEANGSRRTQPVLTE
jgi:hypothetical protein